MNKLVETLLISLPLSLILILAGMYLGGEVWAKGKIVLGDILKCFGWAGRSVRKLSVKSEYEGTINSIIQEYNKNFENPFMPMCKIVWVTSENQQNILHNNEAIICLSFDKKDHNLNFYNATLNFVQTGLISKAKDYLTKQSAKAIDLLTTHIILRNNRREVLTTFRQKLREFDEPTRQEFEDLIPTNDSGLFLNMLLPELHFYGELIDTLPPSSDYTQEANGFLSWFKELATRELDEKTNLRYISKNFKIGIILVGKDETWENYGASAYIKWANYYAAENYNAVYVLARGSNGYKRATTVTQTLTNSKGFDPINKNPKIKCVGSDGKEYLVTCYSLRPNRATIAYLAWENFKEYQSKAQPVPAIIDTVLKDSIVANIFGLKFELLNDVLSEIEISDSRKIFRKEDEIYLNIVEFNQDKQTIAFSNKGTISDPKHYIEAVLKDDKVYDCKVEKIQIDKQSGLQVGLKASNPDLKSWIYIPKSNVTASRFLDFNNKFPVGTQVRVVIEKYNSSASNFVGYLETLINPWETEEFYRLKVGDTITPIVKQISEFSIDCEINEGLECHLNKYEIAWKATDSNTSRFKLDEKIEAKIIYIDGLRRRINISLKRLTKTPELEYFDNNVNKIVEVEVVNTVPSKGIAVKYSGSVSTAFIPYFEIGYGPVGKFEEVYKPKNKIKVLVSEFDADRNQVRFSIKRQYKHSFEDWLKVVDEYEVVEGKIIRHFENSVHIELLQENYYVQAFILRREISNYTYIEKQDLIYYLPVGEIFHFYISEINEDRKSVSLTRKEFLNSLELSKYGNKISTRYVKENSSNGYFYSDNHEGWFSMPEKNIPLGSIIEVIPLSHASGEFQII